MRDLENRESVFGRGVFIPDDRPDAAVYMKYTVDWEKKDIRIARRALLWRRRAKVYCEDALMYLLHDLLPVRLRIDGFYEELADRNTLRKWRYDVYDSDSKYEIPGFLFICKWPPEHPGRWVSVQDYLAEKRRTRSPLRIALRRKYAHLRYWLIRVLQWPWYVKKKKPPEIPRCWVVPHRFLDQTRQDGDRVVATHTSEGKPDTKD